MKKSIEDRKEDELFMENTQLAEVTIDPEKIVLLISQEDKYIKKNILRVKNKKREKSTLTETLLKNQNLTEDQIGQLFDVLYLNWKDANKELNNYRHQILNKITNVYITLLRRNDQIIKPVTKEEKLDYEYMIRERKALMGYIEDMVPEITTSRLVRKFRKYK